MVNVNDFDVAIPAGDMFSTLFGHQHELMLKYHDIEENNLRLHIPHPTSINIDEARCQLRLKEFAWRITEELTEATSCLTVGMNDQGLIHYLEELIDALHFTIEFDIMAGFGPSGLAVYHPQRDMLEHIFEQHPRTALNPKHYDAQRMLRQLTYLAVEKLGEAMNCLKNKPWKSTHMKTDPQRFRSLVVEFNHQFFELLAASGFNAVSLTKCYLNKNAVNQFRIRSNY